MMMIIFSYIQIPQFLTNQPSFLHLYFYGRNFLNSFRIIIIIPIKKKKLGQIKTKNLHTIFLLLDDEWEMLFFIEKTQMITTTNKAAREYNGFVFCFVFSGSFVVLEPGPSLFFFIQFNIMINKCSDEFTKMDKAVSHSFSHSNYWIFL